MREILFKAKRTDNGEWVEGFYVCCRRSHYILPIFNDYEQFHSFDDRFDNWIEIDISTLCQYAGLPDENSKKIFENDIVRDLEVYLIHKSYFEDGIDGEENYEKYRNYGEINIVKFCTEDIGSCGCCYPEFEGSGFKAKGINLNECEVIGNIFDNPELLRKIRDVHNV